MQGIRNTYVLADLPGFLRDDREWSFKESLDSTTIQLLTDINTVTLKFPNFAD